MLSERVWVQVPPFPPIFDIVFRGSSVAERLVVTQNVGGSTPSLGANLTVCSASLVKRLVLETRFRWFKSNHTDHLFAKQEGHVTVAPIRPTYRESRYRLVVRTAANSRQRRFESYCQPLPNNLFIRSLRIRVGPFKGRVYGATQPSEPLYCS